MATLNYQLMGQDAVSIDVSGAYKASGAYPRNRAVKIQALSDSILNRGSYTQFNVTHAGIPLWTANTAFGNGNVMKTSLGHLYYTTTSGTTGSAEPTHITGSAADGGCTWFYYPAYVAKDASSAIFWAEKYSNGQLFWDMSNAYNCPSLSCNKVIVINGGKNYRRGDQVLGTVAGVKFRPNIGANGTIESVDVENIGYNTSGFLDYTITTSTGSGAVLSLVHTNGGTFGVPGGRTRDARARVPDVVASDCEIVVVMTGSNDGTLDVLTYADAATVADSVITDLKYIYGTLVAAGKKVVMVTLGPKTRSAAASGLISPVIAYRNKVRNFQRAFYRKEAWANPDGIDVAIADHSYYWADGATAVDPIGSFSLAVGGVTNDGTHPNTLGAQTLGKAIFDACLPWIGDSKFVVDREAQYGGGFNRSYNKGGNLLEGLPWSATTAYVVGDQVSNDSNKIYRCTVAGTSAGSGGPTGTGTGIVDGTCQWNYARAGGRSVFGSGTGGTITAAGGVTQTGSLIPGVTWARQGGTASGTIVFTQPVYGGGGSFKGQSQRISISLGGGTVAESWRLLFTSDALANLGLDSTDLNSDYFTFEVEMAINAVANMYCPSIQLFGNSGILSNYDGYGTYSGATTGGGGAAGWELMPTTGGFFPYPNNGRLFFRTPKVKLPNGFTTVNSAIYFNFNASGAAGSATADIELFYAGIRKVGV